MKFARHLAHLLIDVRLVPGACNGKHPPGAAFQSQHVPRRVRKAGSSCIDIDRSDLVLFQALFPFNKEQLSVENRDAIGCHFSNVYQIIAPTAYSAAPIKTY
jgi:hypothetical protein